MYDQYFKLSEEPFRLSPDPRFCYGHDAYFRARAYMTYAFMRAEGFVMITGAPGTGKTTLVGDVVKSLADERAVIGNLVSNQLEADDLLRMVAFAFGVEAEVAEKSAVLQRLSRRLQSIQREGGRSLLIVDEAQDLSRGALEELRLLTNLQQAGKPLLQVFLLGQPELRDLVHSPGLDQVLQRIVAASQLTALEEAETRAYVEHRLKVAGWGNDPAISIPVFPIIHLFSEGVPRRINLICSRLFLHSCVERRHRITVADVKAVIQELQDEQLTTRNVANHELFWAEDRFEEPVEVPEEVLEEVPPAAAPGAGDRVDAGLPMETQEAGCNAAPTPVDAFEPQDAPRPINLAAELEEQPATVAVDGIPVAEPLEKEELQEPAGSLELCEEQGEEPGEAAALALPEVITDDLPGRGPATDRPSGLRKKLAKWLLVGALVAVLLAIMFVEAGVFCDPDHRDCGPLAPVIFRMLD